MMALLSQAAALAGDIAAIAALAALLVKPLRQRLFADKAAREGNLCLLRSKIVGIYYANLERRCLREYEYENMSYCYWAYKALGGNSFVEHIYEEMEQWQIVA